MADASLEWLLSFPVSSPSPSAADRPPPKVATVSTISSLTKLPAELLLAIANTTTTSGGLSKADQFHLHLTCRRLYALLIPLVWNTVVFQDRQWYSPNQLAPSCCWDKLSSSPSSAFSYVSSSSSDSQPNNNNNNNDNNNSRVQLLADMRPPCRPHFLTHIRHATFTHQFFQHAIDGRATSCAKLTAFLRTALPNLRTVTLIWGSQYWYDRSAYLRTPASGPLALLRDHPLLRYDLWTQCVHSAFAARTQIQLNLHITDIYALMRLLTGGLLRNVTTVTHTTLRFMRQVSLSDPKDRFEYHRPDVVKMPEDRAVLVAPLLLQLGATLRTLHLCTLQARLPLSKICTPLLSILELEGCRLVVVEVGEDAATATATATADLGAVRTLKLRICETIGAPLPLHTCRRLQKLMLERIGGCGVGALVAPEVRDVLLADESCLRGAGLAGVPRLRRLRVGKMVDGVLGDGGGGDGGGSGGLLPASLQTLDAGQVDSESWDWAGALAGVEDLRDVIVSGKVDAEFVCCVVRRENAVLKVVTAHPAMRDEVRQAWTGGTGLELWCELSARRCRVSTPVVWTWTDVERLRRIVTGVEVYRTMNKIGRHRRRAARRAEKHKQKK